MKSSDYQSGRERIVFWVVGWVVVVVVGLGLVWVGFALGNLERVDRPSSAAPTVASPLFAPTLVSPPAIPTLVPTITPLPVTMPTAEPTVPPSATPTPLSSPVAVVGESGANVRSGPGANFAKLGYLDPGTQVPVIGRYADWWQIEYSSAPAWVFDGIVTASNTDGVAEVQPPPSPTPAPPPPATAVPTQPPPTQAPADYRGLRPNDFQVEGAPGPFGAGAEIWFNFWITNESGAEVKYKALGVVVEETGQFQQSWTYSEFAAGKKLSWRDNINIPSPGTYNLWLTICFRDDACFRMLGPITVIVQ